jgi:hypothetical protein
VGICVWLVEDNLMSFSPSPALLNVLWKGKAVTEERVLRARYDNSDRDSIIL